MIVTKLTVEHFRNIDKWASDLVPPRTMIVGDNAKGKTSRIDAIRYCLTGRCRGLDGAGRNVYLLRTRDIEDRTPMKVEIEIEHGGKAKTVTRSWNGVSSSFKVSGFTGTPQEQENALMTWLGVPSGTLQAILDGETFLTMAHQDAKELLLDTLKVQITDPDTGEILELGQVEAKNAEAIEERKTVKRALTAVGKPIGPDEPNPPDEYVAELEDRLKGYVQERDGLIARRAEIKGAAKGSATTKRQHLEKAQHDAVRDRERTLKAWGFQDFEHVTLATVQASAAECVSRRKALLEDVKTLEAQVTANKTGPSYELLLEAVDKIERHQPGQGCVLSVAIACPAKAKIFQDEGKRLKDEAAAVKAHSDTTKRIKNQLETVRSQVMVAEEDVKVWSERVETYQAMAARVEKAAADLASAGDLEAVPAESPEVLQLTRDITTFDAKIEKGKGIIAGKRQLQQEHKAFNSAMQKRAALESDLEAAEKACEKYGPNGIRVQALNQGIAKFEASMTQALQPFGYTLQLSTEPWAILVNKLPLAMLSTSERMRVAVALQCALAEVTGIDFTLIDNLEWLMQAAWRQLVELVKALPALEQVIMVKALYDEDTPVPSSSTLQILEV